MPRDIEATARGKLAWLRRRSGWSYKQIAAELGVSYSRANQIVLKADERIGRACAIYDGPVTDPIVYGIDHEFTAEQTRFSSTGRVSRV